MVSTSKPTPASGRRPATAPPNAKDRSRGSRAGDPGTGSATPGQEFGAAGQKDDGPDASAGAGSRPGGPGGRGSSPKRH
jgi:hypothetical protein